MRKKTAKVIRKLAILDADQINAIPGKKVDPKSLYRKYKKHYLKMRRNPNAKNI